MPCHIWRARVIAVRRDRYSELVVRVGRELVALRGRAVRFQGLLGLIVEDACISTLRFFVRT